MQAGADHASVWQRMFFTQSEVGGIFSIKNFINIKLDMEKTRWI